MEYKFEVITKKEYKIIRDYYVSNDNLQGIYFLLYDEENKELITKFLKKELINNQFKWKRKKLFQNTLYTIGVETGKEDKVIVEIGTLVEIKRNSTEGVSVKRNKAEKVTFLMKKIMQK